MRKSKPMNDVIELKASLKARDELRLRLETVDGNIVSSRLQGIGCPELLSLMNQWRPQLTGRLDEVELPSGTGHAVILLRELLLKAQGKWQFPYNEPELCHCRMIPTKVVDDAIVGGAHSLETIMRQTSACTSCGSCRPDIEGVLKFRLGR